MYKRALTPSEVLALSQPLASYVFATTPTPVEGATTYTYSCVAGATGPPATLAKNFATGAWAWVNGVVPNCICAPGSLQAGSPGALTCTPCAAGSYATTITAPSCTLCSTLGPNAVAPNAGSATCSCAAGFTAAGSGASLTCSCAAGSVLSGGGSVCTPCAAGSYSSAASSSSCSPCGANTYSAAAGASVCAACPAGSSGSSASGGSTSCVCNANTYSTGALGTLACPACPAGSVSAANSTSCVCSANFKTNGATGSALKCTCPDQWLVSGTGAAQSCAPPPPAAPLTSGNLVALRVGDGLATLSTALAQVYLDEFSPSGALVQSIGTPLALSGTDPTVGALTHSSDGVFVVFAGFTGVGSGQALGGGASPSFGAFARTAVARFDASGAINASTTLSAAAYNGVLRSACSPDGSFYVLVGNASGANAGLSTVVHGGGDADLARVLASPADFVACFAASSASLFLARNAPGAPTVGGSPDQAGGSPPIGTPDESLPIKEFCACAACSRPTMRPDWKRVFRRRVPYANAG